MKIIPLVVDSLGAIPKQCGNRLKDVGSRNSASSDDSFIRNGYDIKKGS